MNTQRMYLHSVITKENLLKARNSGADAGGASERAGKVTSGDMRNLLSRLLEVKSDDFYQFSEPAAAPRGSFNPATNTISLPRNADLSTFLHEAGHYFFASDIALASELVRISPAIPGGRGSKRQLLLGPLTAASRRSGEYGVQTGAAHTAQLAAMVGF